MSTAPQGFVDLDGRSFTLVVDMGPSRAAAVYETRNAETGRTEVATTSHANAAALVVLGAHNAGEHVLDDVLGCVGCAARSEVLGACRPYVGRA